MPQAGAESGAPRLSIVVAVSDPERGLGELIDSIEAQTFPLDRAQVVLVDDGSHAGSSARVEAWQRRRPELVTVVSEPVSGSAAARNMGLAHVRGEWVTFVDPDHVLGTRFLAEVDAFLSKRPETTMVATRRVVLGDADAKQSRHVLHGPDSSALNRLRNLDDDTGHFHGYAAPAFFRTSAVLDEGVRFDERLRPAFDDGHFANLYLLRVPEPLVAYLPDAVSTQSTSEDDASQPDRSWDDPGRLTDVVEHGYLSLLREGAERRGRPPAWLQAAVIYELSGYLRTNDRRTSAAAEHGDSLARFHELLEEVCGLLDESAVESYRATSFKATWREMLRHGYRSEPWHAPYAVVDKLDAGTKTMRVSYRFTGERPSETFVVNGKRVEPAHQKIRDVRLFERTLLHERIAWVPFGTVRLVLDGRDLEMRTSDPPPPELRLTASTIRKQLEGGSETSGRKTERGLSLGDRAVLRLARTRWVRWHFRDAWVLTDRVFNADDSAEHLFRYLRENRPRINAWFVIERGTPDDRRLRRDGYGRVVAHGSLTWKLLMLNCLHVVSSHIDDVIVRPPAIRRLVEPRWRITFLQHGIIKDDLSTWLNRKNIDVFVTSTRAEQESIVGDHTTYRYTTREVKLTGLPRFDRVLAEGRRFPPEQRDLILVAPTWRQWLSTSEQGTTGRHTVHAEDLRTSQYGQEWTAFLASPELSELAERTGLNVALLLHPNFQDTARLDTPPHVTSLHFEGQNAQELFARARVLVTDYSSMFFNAAYIERPVVYFQFDRDRINAGGHLGRRGYFDYERDGYGPVALTVDGAVAAVVKTVESGPEPEPEYLDRIRASFPRRDGRCCERVANAIVASTKASPAQEGRAPVLLRLAGRVRRLGRRTTHGVRRSSAKTASPGRG
jgi:hypothetical protein